MNIEFKELEKSCMTCQKCELCRTRNNVVFGVGKENSSVLFVGEGPGENEDLKAEPFVGRAGKLLDKYLTAIDLDRNKNIYITNIVKCRPPKNRDPLPEEQKACLPWFREQIKIINPKIIVCLGRIASQILIDPKFKVTVEHGKFFSKGKFLIMGTFHPAALLRNPSNKGPALEDFISLREKLEEISS